MPVHDLKAKAAENYIKSVLQQYGLNLTKPERDENGADLVGFVEIKAGASYVIIQSKHRSISKSNFVDIKIEYVSPIFVLFVCVPKQD